MSRTKIIVQQFILLAAFVSVVQVLSASSLAPISSCPVYLTISSKSTNPDNSPIIINWGPDCKNPPKWIGLYDKNPALFSDEPMAVVVTNNSQKGVYETKMTIGSFKLPVGWNKDDSPQLLETPQQTNGQCLPFFVASFNEKALMSLDCLKIQPSWMNDIKNLKDVPLKHLFIPGTHCSGCYYNKSNAQNILVQKFGVTQNFDVWTQLVLGIRYLDISVGYNDDVHQPQKFWAVNENLFITPISEIIQDVKRFITLADEIVIIDFHAFPIGFNRDRHIQLLKYLERKCSHLAVPNDRVSHSYDLTIRTMENKGKLLITYNQPDMEKETNIIWPSWKRFSAKDARAPEMKDYMSKVFSRKYNKASDEPIGWTFFGRQGLESSYESGSLSTTRERAYRINHDMSVWLGGVWSLSANVVAMDYFYSTNMIDMAIHINRHKSNEITGMVFFDVDVK